MKFILVMMITMSAMGEKPKTIEMRIPQETREECLKSAKTYKFSLPIPLLTISAETRCEPRKEFLFANL